MIYWWDAFWMLAAAVSWVLVRRLSPEASRRLGALGVAVAVLYFVGAGTFGWSVRGDAVDPYVDAPFVFLIALGGMTFSHMLRRPWSSVGMGALSVICLVFWPLLALARGFSDGPPSASGDLPDGHRYTATASGMAFTDLAFRTEVFWTPRWLPFAERRVGESTVQTDVARLDASDLLVDHYSEDGHDRVRLYASGELIGDVTY